MKVLIIPSWYSIAGDPMAGIFVREQAKALSKCKIDVGLIFSNLSFQWHQFRSTTSIEDNHGFPVVRADGFFLPKINRFLINQWAKTYGPLYKLYVDKFGSPDLIHAHSIMGGYAAKYLAKKHDIPYVITEHSSQFIDKTLKNRHRVLAEEVYRDASKVIAVGVALKSELEKMTRAQVEIIPNLVDTSRFTPNLNGNRKKDGMNFISVGSLEERKNYDLLIRAFAEYLEVKPKATLTIIGEGSMKNKLQKYIERNSLSNKVFLPGMKDQQEVMAYLDRSDVFISSSTAETFGIVIIEAMAMGLPVISTASGGPEDILDASNGILIPTNDLPAMKKAMHDITEQFENYNPENIRAEIVAKYDEKVIGNRLIAIYDSILKNRSKALS